MNERTDLDRLLTSWLTADAPIREPEPLLGEVLARTARTRRRSAWRIPERWFPVSTITTRVEGASQFPWRTVGVIALLVLALAVGALLVGSRAKPVPAPFGPAHNGALTFSVNGDIRALDSPTGTSRAVIDGAAFDSGALFSPDGIRIAFVRGIMESADAELWAADADGSHQRLLAATPYIGWAEWSPQGDAVAVSLDAQPTVIRMVRADGTGSTDIETGLAAAVNPIFRPSDGRQVTFRGKATDGTWGLYMIGRDGSGLQRLDLDPGFSTDVNYPENSDYYFDGPAWSPDGTQLIYYTLEPALASLAGPGFRIHVADVKRDGAVSAERMLEFEATADDEYAAAWLPAGDRIVFETIEGAVHRLMVADLAPGSHARDLGLKDTEGIGFIVSPDGREVISSTKFGGNDRVIAATDLETLQTVPIPGASDDWSWQRTAP
ncbi:MAG: TolB family protein [Chloroflexota bacterium]